MSRLNKVFSTVPVKIPDRSGFDLSHESLFTALPGTMVPASWTELIPGDTITCGSQMKVTLPPFAVPFMGRIDAELTAAFIPYRLLWKGWESFITQNNGVQSVSNGGNSNLVPLTVPLVSLTEANRSLLGVGSLAHYLGAKMIDPNGTLSVSAMPFLAYQKFIDDWVIDTNNMKPFFAKNPLSLTTSNGAQTALAQLSSHLINSVSVSSSTVLPLLPQTPDTTSGSVMNLASTVDLTIGLGSLRQRCWAKDYFTTATTRPQAGADASVTFDTSGSTGNFTIATLRAANSLQKWMERNNIAGTRYSDQILAHFGVTPPDAVLDRSVLLGSVRTPVYVGSVENNTTNLSGASEADTRNPFGGSLGAAAGFGSGFDKGSLCDSFTAKEHGVFMVFFCLIPHAYYDAGIDRSLFHKTYGDFAWPEFANIGDQPIKMFEIASDPTGGSPGSVSETDIFGYNQRYAEYKHKLDRVSGLVETNQNLSVYALKRSFYLGGDYTTGPELGKEFLEIPSNFLDQVSNVGSEVSNFGCIVDAYFDMRALRVLPEYSLPSL